MFHEHRDLISQLKQSDAHFSKLFDEHNALDEQINNLEKDPVASHRHDEIEGLKKQKLHLKDEIFTMLQKHA